MLFCITFLIPIPKYLTELPAWCHPTETVYSQFVRAFDSKKKKTNLRIIWCESIAKCKYVGRQLASRGVGWWVCWSERNEKSMHKCWWLECPCRLCWCIILHKIQRQLLLCARCAHTHTRTHSHTQRCGKVKKWYDLGQHQVHSTPYFPRKCFFPDASTKAMHDSGGGGSGGGSSSEHYKNIICTPCSCASRAHTRHLGIEMAIDGYRARALL